MTFTQPGPDGAAARAAASPGPPDQPPLHPGPLPAAPRRLLPLAAAPAATAPPDAGAPESGTVSVFVTGSVRGGLLERGRGLAGVPPGTHGPGRSHVSRTGRTAVEIRIVDGQEATDRQGAAELLEMPLNTVRVNSAPARRPESGFPAPLPGSPDRRDWFALTALRAYKLARQPAPAAPPDLATDDADELDVAGFARLRGVDITTMRADVTRSLNAWDRGDDGYLPHPDRTEPASHGNHYYWSPARARAWTFPATPRRSTGRPPAGRTATLTDLQAVLDAAADQPRPPTVRDLAAALSERLGTDVSTQTVKRLRRKQREQSGDSAVDPAN